MNLTQPLLRQPLWLAILCCLTSSPPILAETLTSDNYTLSATVLSNGGGETSSSEYGLTATIGQPFVPIGETSSNLASPLKVETTYTVKEVGQGNHVTYTVTITNLGPETATGLIFTDIIGPEGAELLTIKADASGKGCDKKTASCELPDLASNASIQVELVVQNKLGEAPANIAQVNSDNYPADIDIIPKELVVPVVIPPVVPPEEIPPVTPSVETPPVTPSVETPPVTPSVETPPVTPSLETPPVTPSVETPPVTPSVETPPVTPSVETPPVTPTVETPPVTPSVETPPVTPTVETPPVTPTVETPPVTPTVETPPVTLTVETPPVTPTVETPPVTPSVETPPVTPTVETPPVTSSVETPPVTPSVETPPVTPSVETPPATSPVESTTAVVPPTPSVVLIPSTACPTEGDVTVVCNAYGQTLKIEKILPGGQVSNGVLTGSLTNQGWVSNLTITTTGKLIGGTVTGYIKNQGVMRDFEFKGMSIIGGSLGGTIRNTSKTGGFFQNVTLLPDTQITGGTLKGTIKGDPNSPASLEQVRIKSGSHLSGVKLGKGVKLEKGVVVDTE